MLITLLLTSATFAAHWAVIVAGSNGFTNYRHQADANHCYQVLMQNGFDPSKIIFMAYDDMATASSNPFPGQIFSRPDGPNVYIGTENHDYVKTNVTAANFMKVLLGDETAGGKVLKSTQDDNVFVFYADHGSAGVLAMPTGGYVYADVLNKTLAQMYEKKMFKKLVLYISACYSGSMFKNLLPNDHITYAMTAANEKESGYGDYCGIAKYKTCLTSEFPRRWMEHSENIDLSHVDIETQHALVVDQVAMSHVQEFGDFSFKSDMLSEFQAGADNKKSGFEKIADKKRIWTAVSQADAYLSYLRTAAEQDIFGSSAIEYHNALAQKRVEDQRLSAMNRFFGVADSEFDGEIAKDMDLYRAAIEAFESVKGRLNELNFWNVTILLTRAINAGKLTTQNIGAFGGFLRTLA